MSVSKARTFRNIIYTSLGKGLTLFCVALTSMVVARNLAPSDYGVIGFANIIIGFLSRFSDMGVGSAVIRRPQLHPLRLSGLPHEQRTTMLTEIPGNCTVESVEMES